MFMMSLYPKYPFGCANPVGRVLKGNKTPWNDYGISCGKAHALLRIRCNEPALLPDLS